MPHQVDDDGPASQSPAVEEPDAHGQAALILAESILHALIETETITAEKALDIVRSAQEIKTEIAGQTGESKARMNESLELLNRIGVSLEKEVH